jgi:hypothetical protein
MELMLFNVFPLEAVIVSLPDASEDAAVTDNGFIKSTLTVPAVLTVSNVMLKPRPGIEIDLSFEDIWLSIGSGLVPGASNSPGDNICDAVAVHDVSGQVIADNNNPDGKTTFAGIGWLAINVEPVSNLVPEKNVCFAPNIVFLPN